MVVTICREAFFKVVVGYNTQLGKTVDTTVDFEIDPSIYDGVKEIIFVRVIKRGLETEVVDIK